MSQIVNFAQGCRDCRKYYQIFKIDLDQCYDEKGKSKVETKEIIEKFSFTCKKCGLFNVLDFNQLCNEETVLYLRKEKTNYPTYT